MDVPELRTAFELSGATTERIRTFRIERLSKINAGDETPAPLDEQMAKLILHIIPFGAFYPAIRVDLSLLYDPPKRYLLSPFTLWANAQSHGFRYNLDGLMNYSLWQGPWSGADTPSTSYVQVFRNGIVEAVDVSILNASRDLHVFSGTEYERRLLQATTRFGKLQRLLEVDPPWFVMISFLGVKGYRIAHPAFKYELSQYSGEIDRANLIIPEVTVDDFDSDMGSLLKPILDTVWNAAGCSCSLNYDASGNFTLEL